MRAVGLVLVDGLSMLEEPLAAMVHGALGVPVIGGSAADGLAFGQAHVYHDGRFHAGAAVVARLVTSLPMRLFKVQHFEPRGEKLVISGADVETRTVTEINGYPAAEEYARIVGVGQAELTPRTFASHPIMLRIGGEYYVRSIQKANADGSLTFYCAIDTGLVLTLARPGDLVANLAAALAACGTWDFAAAQRTANSGG